MLFVLAGLSSVSAASAQKSSWIPKHRGNLRNGHCSGRTARGGADPKMPSLLGLRLLWRSPGQKRTTRAFFGLNTFHWEDTPSSPKIKRKGIHHLAREQEG